MSKQTTFDQFYTIKNKKKNIFYIDWNHQNPKAIWLIEKPLSTTFEANVKWKDVGTQVTICCTDYIEKNTGIPSETNYANISLLKSHLQKCVRRQLTNKALKTAWHLIKMDINAFIRRLPVIMLEDVHLHESLSPIVWLISAISKGYVIDHRQISWLLGVVSYMCETKQYDCLENNSVIGKKNIPQLIKNINEHKHINDNQKNMLYSLLFRVSYGGMKGDMNMFYNYTLQYLKSVETINMTSSIIPVDFTKIGSLNLDEIEIYSADFHCYPKIIENIVKKFPQYTNEQVKQCLWDCNSKYNTRYSEEHSFTKTEITNMWEVIKSYVDSIQIGLIKTSH